MINYFELKSDPNEEIYRRIVELAQEGIWVIDRNELTIFVNPCMANMLGYDVKEMTGKHLFDFMDDQGIAICKKHLECRRNGIKEQHDFELIRKDGKRIYTIMSVSPTDKDGQYTGAIALVTDITERKQAEDKLKKSEEKLRSIFEFSPNNIALANLDGVLLDCNQGAVDMHGLTSKEDLIGKKLLPLIAESDREVAKQAWFQAIQDGYIRDLELTLLKTDRSRLNVLLSANVLKDSQGKPYAVLAIIRDITEQKRIEDELKESEEKMGNLIKYAPTGIFEVDFHDPKFKNVNDVMCKYLKYTKEELLAMNPLELLDEQGREFIRHRIQKWLAGEKIKNTVEYKVKARCGREYYVILNVTLTYQDGKPQGAMIIAHDITERKLIEEEKQITIEFLRLVNESENIRDLIRLATAFFQQKSGCEAVGIRLRSGQDYPYYETRGFPKAFVLVENRLCDYDEDERLRCDSDGNPILECMCGNVIRGKIDPSQPFFTEKGSFWTNNTSELLANTAESDGQARTRNRCNKEQFESVALIPMRHCDESLGLLQLNDKRNGIFSIAYIHLWERLADHLAVALSKFQAEEALQESQTRLYLALDAANSGIWEWNIRTGESLWSDEIWKLYGLEPNSCKPSFENWWQIVHPDDQVRIDQIIWETVRRGVEGSIEWRLVNRNGEQERWFLCRGKPLFDANGQVERFIGIVMDITERKRKTDAILASERELLQVTLNSLGEGVVATDREEQIILINKAAANLTGYSESEAIGEPLSKILYIINDKTSEPRTKIVSHEIYNNVILVTRDLKEVPVSTNSSPIKTADGAIMGTVTVFQDISEKQKTERELLRADKLESLGILAGGIAHDFNNTLAAILSNIQLAMLKMRKNEDIKLYLNNTIETARKASQLTKQLLTFSKGGAPVKKDASLIELIKDTAEFVLRGSNIKAEFEIPEDLWTASIDEGQISQVIHNLVLNAKQAMPRGGVIHISAENITTGSDTRFCPGEYVKITVKDQDAGIPQENLLKIFDPFFTTKKNGNGLGLATSYSIITRHNGYIDVESQKDGGTTFLVYLPASNIQVLPVESAKGIAVSGGGFKILVMDDEQKILNAVGEMLRCYGYRVALTADGAEAINIYKQAMNEGEPFDAVLMDLTVPGGMGGQETVAYLRDLDPKIKAIVTSGYANDTVLADYERYGFVGMVSKPYKIDELNEILIKVIDPTQLSLKLIY